MINLSNLLFLLVFLCSFDAYAQTCSALLKPDHNSSNLSIHRPDRHISDSKKSRAVLQDLDKKGVIVANTNSPYSRKQCYGTCYAYASIYLLENALIQSGLIEAGDLVLAPSILAQIAQSRITTEKRSNSFNFRELLRGGYTDVFHALHGNSIFYLPKSEIKKLGPLIESSELVLDLEHSFLSEFFNLLSQPGSHYDVLSEIEDVKVNNGFIDSLSKHAQKDNNLQSLNHQTLGPIFIEYEKYVRSEEQDLSSFIIQSNVNTSEHKTNELEYGPSDKNLFRHVSNNFFDDESIGVIVQQLQNNNFVVVALKEGIFSGVHAVTLTNLVKDPETGTPMGFIFLDSNHKSQGLLGYRFISIRELKENTTFFFFIKNIGIL